MVHKLIHKVGTETIDFVQKGGNVFLEVSDIPSKAVLKAHKDTVGRMR